MMSKKWKSFEKMIADFESASNPDLFLFELTIKRASEKSPMLADALLYCAIPRLFDEEIIGILRDKPDDVQTNVTLLGQLKKYEFVLEKGNNKYAYHDKTRDLLLDDWHSTEEKLVHFREYNQRIIEFYEKRWETARENEEAWREIGAVVFRASQHRYIDIEAKIKQNIRNPLFEILYHNVLSSVQEGFLYFRGKCFELEITNPSLCLSLNGLARDYFDTVAPKSTDPEEIENKRLWLEYFEARLRQNIYAYDLVGLSNVVDNLRELEKKPGVKKDFTLHAWILNQLGNVLSDLTLYHEALQAHKRSLNIRKKHDIDLFNEPVDLSNIANLYWSQKQFGTAVQYYQDSIKKAREKSNKKLEYSSSCNTYRLFQLQGKWKDALTGILEMHMRALTQDARNQQYHFDIIRIFPYLLANKDYHLLDSSYNAILTLINQIGDPRNQIDWHLNYIDLLVDSGQMERAEEEIEICNGKLKGTSNPVQEINLLYSQGFIFKEMGALDKAIEQFENLSNHSHAKAWDKAAALHNRAAYNVERGNFDEGGKCVRAAIERWESMGVDKLAALARTNLAKLLINQAEYNRLQDQIAIPNESIFGDKNHFQINDFQVKGKLDQMVGDWPGAQTWYQKALEISTSTDSFTESAIVNLDLACLAAKQSAWKEAAKYAKDANTILLDLSNGNVFSSLLESSEVNHQVPKTEFIKAQEQLDLSKQSLFEEDNQYQISFLRVQGQIYQLTGNWSNAQSSFKKALAISNSYDFFSESADICIDLARVAANQSNWDEAAQVTKDVYDIWNNLSVANSYRPTKEINTAENNFREGLRLLILQSGESGDNLKIAQELFWDATKINPPNIIYSLYWMYASASNEDWKEAIQATQIIENHGPGWINQHPFVFSRRAEYLQKQAMQFVSMERYNEAAIAYTAIPGQLTGRASLDKLLRDWLELGDHYLKFGKTTKALDIFQSALASEPVDNLAILGTIHVRIGYLEAIGKLVSDTKSEVGTHFIKALELFREGEPTRSLIPEDNKFDLLDDTLTTDVLTPGELLGKICLSLLESIKDYWTLDSIFGFLEDENKHFVTDLTDARESLSVYLDDMYQLAEKRGESAQMLPVVTPIALELSSSLLPVDDENWIVLKEFAPEMRSRIQSQFGIKIPGIRVRESDNLPLGAYSILLDEEPVATGTLKNDQYYCPKPWTSLGSTGISVWDIIEDEDPHPLTGEVGFWVSPKHEAIFRDRGIELWRDHQLYMIYHLEAILHDNLIEFVGVQEIENMIETWADEDGGRELIDTTLPDTKKKLCLIRLVRALLKEQVSVVRWRDILQLIAEIGLSKDDIFDEIRAVRVKLKDDLPGNNPDKKLLFAPENFEQGISNRITTQNKTLIMDIPPDETVDLMNELRDFVGTDDKNLVLVARDAKIRPFMKQLVEMEFPHIHVLAKEEVLSPEKVSPFSE